MTYRHPSVTRKLFLHNYLIMLLYTLHTGYVSSLASIHEMVQIIIIIMALTRLVLILSAPTWLVLSSIAHITYDNKGFDK